MRLLAFALALTLLPLQPAEARWQVKSDFLLHLTESTFDQVIQDFWQSLQGAKHIPVGNIPVNLGDTKLAINGVNVDVNYSFALPQRVDPTHREWELRSEKLGGKITVDQLLATQRRTVMIGGIPLVTEVTVECRNISLVLPEGAASVQARVRALVTQNQVQLSMPSYSASWPNGSWQLQNLNCPELANLDGMIREEILKFLSSFQNLDSTVSSAITSAFEKWSKDASILLLSQHELPTTSDHLRVFYEPQTATENNGNGLILGGILRFDYPNVAQGQNFEREFHIPADYTISPQNNPQLMVPFATIRALMMGQYFSGKLDYTMRSNDLPAFQDLMQSRFQQFFGWPDLMRYPTNTSFLFELQPLGPPSFENETAGPGNSIMGDLTLPLTTRMYAPLGGNYYPYVEFRTLISGPASMQLLKGGKVQFNVNATQQPATYSFADWYVKYYKPSTHIAIDTIASATRDSLNTKGLEIAIPTFTVGKQLQLVPDSWELDKNKVMRLNFSANASNSAPVTSKMVKTATGKKLNVTSARSKK